MANFAERLFEAVEEKKSPLCVGLDPRIGKIPVCIKKQAIEAASGDMLAATAEALYRFNTAIIDAVADVVPVIKPNIAFYEKFGPIGFEAYIKTVKYAMDAGLVVLGDVKRGDIGSTSGSYADEFLGKVELIDGSKFSLFGDAIDAITINAYFGTDSTEPFLGFCSPEYGKGAFLLCKTSNPSSADIQDVFTSEDMTVCEVVAELIDGWGEKYVGSNGYSSVAAVVGATSDMQEALRKRMPRTPFLVPGYGAQGGGAEGVVPSFDEKGSGAVVNSSRGIIFAYEKLMDGDKPKYAPEQFADAAREAAIASTRDIVGALKKYGKDNIFR